MNGLVLIIDMGFIRVGNNGKSGTVLNWSGKSVLGGPLLSRIILFYWKNMRNLGTLKNHGDRFLIPLRKAWEIQGKWLPLQAEP